MWSSLEGRAGSAESAPCSRSKHSAALLDGYVWVLAGRGNGPKRPLRDLWRYSLATHVWERLPSLGDAPPSLEQHSCIAHDGKLYVFGGELAPAGDTPLWIYDTQVTGILSGVWRKVPSSSAPAPRSGRPHAASGPRGRRAHLAFDLQDCMLIYGGYMDLKGSTDEMWAFHYESERWQQVRAGRGSAGGARHGAAGCVRGPRLYVHAGRTDLKLRSDLHYYDTESRSWHEVRCPARVSPAARCGHAGVRAGAHLYIFGGQTDALLADDLWRFHFDSETWERIENKPQWPSARVEGCALLISTVVTRPNSLKTTTRRNKGAANGYSANGYTDGSNGNGGYSDGTKSYSNNGGITNYDSNDDSYGYSSMCSSATPQQESSRRRSPPPAPRAPPATPATPSGPSAPAVLLREISKLSSHIRRTNRCSYTALPTELEWFQAEGAGAAALPKSVSAHGLEARAARTHAHAHAHARSPHDAAAPVTPAGEMSREPISVPNFADLVVAQPVLTPVQAARLVYLDSDDERDYNTALQPQPATPPAPPSKRAGVTVTASGVRFSAGLPTPAEEDHPYCTSDYASAEKINRLSVVSGTSLGFCNPHYLGPDVRRLSALSPHSPAGLAPYTPYSPCTPAAPRAAFTPATPDSGVSPGDIELRDLSRGSSSHSTLKDQAKHKGTRLLVLLVGGRETQRLALMQSPLSLWTYRLL